ncbi:MAG: hypothetical protein Kow00108_08140 [Calditrichia bacterium]
MASLKIQIDGKWIEANPDDTILNVARKNGIEIPTLCHDDQLEPYTSCFLCVVEVEGARTLQPACATKVRDGMVVRTNSDVIESSRKMALELLLSNHFADCLGPCKINCPAGVDVQGYVALSAIGKYKDAVKLIKERNPLPTVCGRVCTRPCELNCRRNIVDEGVAVDDIKRFIADVDLFAEDRYFPEIKKQRREKIAIVGSGPAGLSAAYYLRIEGYNIDIFEAKPKAGGMLRYGIPQYRLPEEVLDKEIEGITKLGVNIHYNKFLGKDFTIQDLFKQGYKSVFLALGAQKSTHIKTEGDDLDGVMAGIEFLAQVKAGDIKKLNGTVAVIGGGNTAVDAARTSLRLGAEKVVMVYRRTIKEMPANPEEIVAAQHEGIDIKFLTNPKRYLGENGKLKAIECIQMELGEPDESGRRRPVPVENSEFEIPVDYVIEAIGQKPDLMGLPISENGDKDGFKLTRWGTFATDPVTMMTNIPGVFAAGDVVLGPATAIEAIAGGRKVANGIHHFITGKWIEEIKTPFISKRDHFRTLTPKDYLKVDHKPRHKRPELDPKERIKTFDEVEKTFQEEDVIDEAIRCLECGCKVFFECDLQKYATEYQADQTAFIGEFSEHEVDNRHPFIEFDLNKCILCGRCVRVCDEVVGASALGLVNRGFVTKIAPSLEKPLQDTSCISCGLCVDTCPTGSISDEFYTVKPGPWKTKTEKSLCNYCSMGCEREAHIVGDQIVRMTTPENGSANPHGNMCFKGRYGYEYLYLSKRINTPYVKENGSWKEVTLEEAIRIVSEKIKSSGPLHEIYASPKLALEDFYQIQKFARIVLKTNNIGSISNKLEPLFSTFPMILNTGSIKEISLSDNVIVLKSDLMKSIPVANFELVKAIRDGKRVVAVAEQKPNIAKRTDWIKVNNEDMEDLLKLLVKDILELASYNKLCDVHHADFMGFVRASVAKINRETILKNYGLENVAYEELLHIFKQKEETFLLTNLDDMTLNETLWFLILQSLVKNTNIKTLGLTNTMNIQGQWLMGLHPELAPGGVKLEEALNSLKDVWMTEISTSEKPRLSLKYDHAGTPDSIWIFGEDPIGTATEESVKSQFAEVPVKIVFDSIWTATAESADIVFPLMPVEECGGLFINAEGKILEASKVVPTRMVTSMIETLSNLAREMDYFMMGETLEAVRGDIARIVPWFDDIFEKLEDKPFITIHEYSTKLKFDKVQSPDNLELPEMKKYRFEGDSILKWIHGFATEKGLKQF